MGGASWEIRTGAAMSCVALRNLIWWIACVVKDRLIELLQRKELFLSAWLLLGWNCWPGWSSRQQPRAAGYRFGCGVLQVLFLKSSGSCSGSQLHFLQSDGMRPPRLDTVWCCVIRRVLWWDDAPSDILILAASLPFCHFLNRQSISFVRYSSAFT